MSASRLDRIEAIYPLTPVQEGMLFECLYAPGGEAYLLQFRCALRGRLDEDAFTSAWQDVVERHGALRTCFVWEGIERPVQVVRRGVPVKVVREDASSEPSAAQDARVAAYLAADRASGFAPGQAPLMRWWLMRRGDEHWDFVWSMHHLIIDGWSTGRVLQEVLARYTARRAGTAWNPGPPSQFRDYVAWLQQQDHAAPERFWRHALAGIPGPTRLGSRQRAASRQYGEIQTVILPAPLDRITAVARRAHVTLNTMVLAAWALVLNRHSGSSDVLFGGTTAGRPATLAGMDTIVGVFINTLPVRVHVPGEQPLRTWLQHLQAQQLEARQYEYSSLVAVQGWSEVPRGTPLFESIVVFENYPSPGATTAGPALLTVDSANTTRRTHYPLTILAQAGSAHGLALTLLYDTGRYDEREVEQVADQLARVLQRFGEDDMQPVARLSLLSPDERAQLVHACNETATSTPNGTVVDWIWAAAARDSGRVAVRQGATSLTYEQLCARSDAVAEAIHAAGVGAEHVVGLAIDRVPELIVGLLGILRAGATYLPLDSNVPEERRAYMSRTAGVDLVLTSRRMAPLEAQPVLMLDELPARPSPAWGPPRVLDDQAAYVMFTSGSTGRPKGVLIAHGALANLMHAAVRREWVTADDTLLAATSPGFDISLLELLLPLVTGATVWLAGSSLALDCVVPLQRREITVMQATPSHARLWLAAGWRPAPGLRALCGGEPVDGDLAGRLLTGGVELWNVYGPTETTIWSSAERITASAPPVLIGRPLDNTRFYIVSPDGDLQPQGAPGELWIGGAGLARGYVAEPDLTAERFVPDPFSGQPGARLYRTGDLAHYTADYRVAVLGRVDAQVKIRGVRIEPAEIEHTILEHDAVEQAAVVVLDQTSPGRRLAAYVVPRSDRRRDEEAGARAHVARWRAVWDDAYGSYTPPADPTLNTAGWVRSDSTELIPGDEMREWVESAANRILARRPARVLEMGCGTGMLLFRVAPSCAEYWGTDASPAALDAVRATLDSWCGTMPAVRLLLREALDLTAMPSGYFDAIVLNSVVQYFPDAEYLLRVLAGASGLLSPNGCVFLGDVRSQSLVRAQHAEAAIVVAPPAASARELEDQVELRCVREQELLIDPALFTRLPAAQRMIGVVDVLLKRGAFANEMTRFRYDVMLTVGDHRDLSCSSVKWSNVRALSALRDTLVDRRPDVLRIVGIPNARVADAVCTQRLLRTAGTAETVRDIRERSQLTVRSTVQPEAAIAVARDAGYVAEALWAGPGQDDSFDLLLVRSTHPMPLGTTTVDRTSPASADWWRPFVSDPQFAARADRLDSSLRTFLVSRLPAPMMPSAFVYLPRMPLTTSGKTDRNALPAPSESTVSEARASWAAPLGPVAELVAQAWEHLLHVPRVGPADDFFRIGGHSLLAVRLAARLEDALRVPIPLRTIFDTPGLAQQIEAVEALVGAPRAVESLPARDGDPAVLSFAQEGFLVLHALDPEASHFHIAVAAHVRPEIDLDVLRRALRVLTERHEALRTGFDLLDNARWGPVVRAEAQWDLHRVCLRQLPVTEQEAALRDALAEEFRRPFALDRPPLARACVAETARGHALMLTAHHLISDHYSVRILAEELFELYAACRSGRTPQLPPVDCQYSDFAAWQRRWVGSDAFQSSLRYWTARLDPPPERLRLPRAATKVAEPTRAQSILPERLVARIDELGRAEGVTTFMVMLAAVEAVLAAFTGQADLAIGVPVGGRCRREFARVVGCFVNTIVFRSDVQSSRTFRELLTAVRRSAIGAYSHQDVPFPLVVDAASSGRRATRNPLYDVTFNYLDGWRTESTKEVSLDPFALDVSRPCHSTLEVHATRGDNRIAAVLLADAAVIASGDAALFLSRLESILDRACALPDIALDDLLAGTERRVAEQSIHSGLRA